MSLFTDTSACFRLFNRRAYAVVTIAYPRSHRVIPQNGGLLFPLPRTAAGDTRWTCRSAAWRLHWTELHQSFEPEHRAPRHPRLLFCGQYNSRSGPRIWKMYRFEEAWPCGLWVLDVKLFAYRTDAYSCLNIDLIVPTYVRFTVPTVENRYSDCSIRFCLSPLYRFNSS